MKESVTDAILKKFAIYEVSLQSQLFNLNCKIKQLSPIRWRDSNSDYFNLIKLLFNSEFSLPN
jgi:hypothetical protein